MAVYEKWQSERYSIGCKVWETRCPNCQYLIESIEPISSSYRFCPYCGFDMRLNADTVHQLEDAKRLLKSAISEWPFVCEWGDCSEHCEWYVNGRCTQEWSGKAEALKLIEDERNEP